MRVFIAEKKLNKIKNNIAKRIKKVRGKRSQAEFADEIDVFQQNISRYEQGMTPHLDFIILLSIKEKISIEWLLFGLGDMKRIGVN